MQHAISSPILRSQLAGSAPSTHFDSKLYRKRPSARLKTASSLSHSQCTVPSLLSSLSQLDIAKENEFHIFSEAIRHDWFLSADAEKQLKRSITRTAADGHDDDDGDDYEEDSPVDGRSRSLYRHTDDFKSKRYPSLMHQQLQRMLEQNGVAGYQSNHSADVSGSRGEHDKTYHTPTPLHLLSKYDPPTVSRAGDKKRQGFAVGKRHVIHNKSTSALLTAAPYSKNAPPMSQCPIVNLKPHSKTQSSSVGLAFEQSMSAGDLRGGNAAATANSLNSDACTNVPTAPATIATTTTTNATSPPSSSFASFTSSSHIADNSINFASDKTNNKTSLSLVFFPAGRRFSVGAEDAGQADGSSGGGDGTMVDVIPTAAPNECVTEEDLRFESHSARLLRNIHAATVDGNCASTVSRKGATASANSRLNRCNSTINSSSNNVGGSARAPPSSHNQNGGVGHPFIPQEIKKQGRKTTGGAPSSAASSSTLFKGVFSDTVNSPIDIKEQLANLGVLSASFAQLIETVGRTKVSLGA